ncbi:hypothetical protein [Promicromonospora sukumoe]|nr:hypothetical protein [Promicromonospora sukumoe]
MFPGYRRAPATLSMAGVILAAHVPGPPSSWSGPPPGSPRGP